MSPRCELLDWNMIGPPIRGGIMSLENGEMLKVQSSSAQMYAPQFENLLTSTGRLSPTISLAARMENGKHFRLIFHIASNRTKGRNVIHPHLYECTRTRQNQVALQPNQRRLGANWHRLIVCRAASVQASLSVGAICLL